MSLEAPASRQEAQGARHGRFQPVVASELQLGGLSSDAPRAGGDRVGSGSPCGSSPALGALGLPGLGCLALLWLLLSPHGPLGPPQGLDCAGTVGQLLHCPQTTKLVGAAPCRSTEYRGCWGRWGCWGCWQGWEANLEERCGRRRPAPPAQGQQGRLSGSLGCLGEGVAVGRESPCLCQRAEAFQTLLHKLIEKRNCSEILGDCAHRAGMLRRLEIKRLGREWLSGSPLLR